MLTGKRQVLAKEFWVFLVSFYPSLYPNNCQTFTSTPPNTYTYVYLETNMIPNYSLFLHFDFHMDLYIFYSDPISHLDTLLKHFTSENQSQ